jgi:hemolysin III
VDAEPLAATVARPLLRGVLHEIAFWCSLAAGALLIATAGDGRHSRLGAVVFATSVTACFGASALYHRVTWRPRAASWMRRVDHSGVYLLIAGTYTPVSLVALSGHWRSAVLGVVWTGAAVAIVARFVCVAWSRWLAAAIGISLGWIAVVALPELVGSLPTAAVVLLVVGGLAYTAGAIVYARGRPDPAPSVFGYHEVFHALTIVGVVCQYTAIAFFVVHTG